MPDYNIQNYKKTILIIDDEPSILEVLAEIAQTIDCNAITALNAEEAWPILQEHPVDLIVCDINMPKMNGLTFLENVIGNNLSTPVVMLTAYADKEKIFEALRLGAIDYITKPFEPEKLVIQLEKLAEIGRRIREIEQSSGVESDKLKQKNKLINLLRVNNNNILKKMTNV